MNTVTPRVQLRQTHPRSPATVGNQLLSMNVYCMSAKSTSRKTKILNWLGPVLGAGAIGVCPLCWAGSAALLSYLGLGALISGWPWIVGAFLALGLIGFALDYRSHRNWAPIVVYVVGGAILLTGRYVIVAPNLGYWYIWGFGAVLLIIAIIYNRRQFSASDSNALAADERRDVPIQSEE